MEFGAKKWFMMCMSLAVGVFVLMIAIVWAVDPYFHFHKPLPFLSYRLYDERYMNDGISRHFDYDAIITGTSMAQNFKTSEADALFGASFVKETFAGSGYRELSENLSRALGRNENLKTVIWAMDANAMLRDKDYDAYEGYPSYLYDDSPFNDVYYVFNKDVWYHGVLANIARTARGIPGTTFDEYSSWEKETGYEHVMANYNQKLKPKIKKTDGFEINSDLTEALNNIFEIKLLARMGLSSVMQAHSWVMPAMVSLALVLVCRLMRNTQEKVNDNRYNFKRIAVTVGLLAWSVLSLSEVSEFLYFNF